MFFLKYRVKRASILQASGMERAHSLTHIHEMLQRGHFTCHAKCRHTVEKCRFCCYQMPLLQSQSAAFGVTKCRFWSIKMPLYKNGRMTFKPNVTHMTIALTHQGSQSLPLPTVPHSHGPAMSKPCRHCRAGFLNLLMQSIKALYMPSTCSMSQRIFAPYSSGRQ